MKLIQRVKTMVKTVKAHVRSNIEKYGLTLTLTVIGADAQASLLAAPICQAFKQLAGNDLYSLIAGLGLVGLLIANALNEGDNKVKSTALKIGIVVTALINAENITTMFTGSGWGC